MLTGGRGWTSNTPGHFHTASSFCRTHGDVTHGGLGGLVSCPYFFPHHCMSYRLSVGTGLFTNHFLIVNKHTWERWSKKFRETITSCLYWNWLIITRSTSRNLLYCPNNSKVFFTTPFLWLSKLLGFPNIGIRLLIGEEERGCGYRVKKTRSDGTLQKVNRDKTRWCSSESEQG